MKHNMIDFQEFFESRLKDPVFRTEWDKVEPQYQLERAIIKARIERGMTQSELAKKVGTTQAVISRIESTNTNPTINMVNKIAKAFGKKLKIEFVSR